VGATAPFYILPFSHSSSKVLPFPIILLYCNKPPRTPESRVILLGTCSEANNSSPLFVDFLRAFLASGYATFTWRGLRLAEEGITDLHFFSFETLIARPRRRSSIASNRGGSA